MKKQAFFNLGTGVNPVKNGKNKTSSKKVGCNACGLYKECKSPRIQPIGEGKKGILIITEYPAEYEDSKNTILSGQGKKLLSKTLDEIDVNLTEDCWITHAVRCYPGDREPTTAEIGYCRSNLLRTIEQLNPKVIITMGKVSLNALIGHRIAGRLTGTAMDKFFGEFIPDQELEKWICPTYSVEWLLKQTIYEKGKEIINPVLLRYWKHSIKVACKKVKGFYTHNYENDVLTTTDAKEAIKWINAALEARKICAFDYETTGLKPHGSKHTLTTCSFSNGLFGYAFPYFSEDKEFCKSWYRFTRSKFVKKVAHNLGFENTWTKYKATGQYVQGWEWDTCLAAHCVDNNKPTNQKFLTYVLFGVLNYDDSVDEFLKPSNDELKKYGANAINNISKADLHKLLIYNAQDSHFCYKIMEVQQAKLKGTFLEGYKFFQTGAEILSQVQNEGLRCDMDLLDKNERILTRKIDRAWNQIKEAPEFKKWKGKDEFNPLSDTQLKKMLYDILKYPKPKKGDKATDKKQLQRLNTDFTLSIIPYREMLKMRDTYLAQFKREQVDGFIRPFFNLNRAVTFRSCIAKGSLVLANKDYVKYPNGIPIEEIKEGDYVYCYDSNLQLALKKVLWAGKTGHRKVVRIHYNGAKGRKAYLDTTPEHRIRLITGEYVQAKDLIADYRDKTDPSWRYRPKCRVLSCRRTDDRLFPTNANDMKEYRFVYEQLSKEVLSTEDTIHHVDHNHDNHEFSNLQKMTRKEHSLHHYSDNLGTESSRKKNIEVVKRKHALGEYTYKKGFNNATCLKLTKKECIELLKQAGGQLTKVPYDFTSFKYNCELNNIDLKTIKLLFGKDGNYIEKEYVCKSLKEVGFSKTQKILGVGYAKLKKICDYYNIGYERGYKNQNGYYVEPVVTLNNHVITHIEYLEEPVDVYDLEIEDEHNFIVNEICVHNSSNGPNFQNMPARDPIALKYVMSCIKPRIGNIIAEWDYKGVEVATSCCYHKDPNMIAYVTNENNDMHRDTAADILLQKKELITKEERQIGKNGFVFPSFYGSGVPAVAPNIWEMLPATSKSHLYDVGIRNYKDFYRHMESVMKIFWEERFPVYAEWKRKTWRDYLKKGYVDLYTGFRYHGPASFTQITNAQIQGSAFHILLWSLSNIYPIVQKNFDKSFLIGQIHDAIVGDINPKDEKEIDSIIKLYGTEKVREHWDWIILPFKLEKESTPVDGSWNTMEGRGFI